MDDLPTLTHSCQKRMETFKSNYIHSVLMEKQKNTRSNSYQSICSGGHKVWCFALAVICLFTLLIPPAQSISVRKHGDIIYRFEITDSRGSIESSTCLNSIKSDTETLFKPTNHPFHSDYHESVGRFNFTCKWILKTKPSSKSNIDFRIDSLDFSNCPESSIRFESASSDSGSRLLATLTPTSPTQDVFSLQDSHLVIIYQSSSACGVNGPHIFHISYTFSPHTRLRREASTNEGSRPSSSPRISQQPEKTPQTIQQQNVQPTGKPLNPPTTSKDGEESDSDNTWKIAVGVVIPVIFISILLFIAYKIYRRKFPVRMILGREFGKFRNPNYQRPRSGLTLVRDDANWDEAANRMSTEYNPDYQTSDLKIPYDNKGFEGDEAEIDLNDESREDKDFRMRKSWLFRKKEDQSAQQNASSSEDLGGEHSKTSSRDEDGDRGKKAEKNTKDEEREFSDDSDIEAMLQEQKVTPRMKRKNMSESDLSVSSNSSEQITKTNETHSENSISSKTNMSDGKIDSCDDEFTENKSNFVEKFEPLFQQPSVDEMRAELKARARSMSGSKCPRPDRQRSHSLQVDPSKSARRGSCTPNESSTAEYDLRRFIQKQNHVTASVVGVAYLTASVRMMYSSLSSVRSNPHLVTDLDDELSDGSSLGNSKRSNNEVEDRLNPFETEQYDSHQETRDASSTDDVKTEATTMEAGDVKFTLQDASVVVENKLENEPTNHKDQSNDNGEGADNVQSTSGSSSSSDTHFEEHHAHMTKPHYTPQISTMSASSEPIYVNLEGDAMENNDKDNEGSGNFNENIMFHSTKPSEEENIEQQNPSSTIQNIVVSEEFHKNNEVAIDEIDQQKSEIDENLTNKEMPKLDNPPKELELSHKNRSDSGNSQQDFTFKVGNVVSSSAISQDTDSETSEINDQGNKGDEVTDHIEKERGLSDDDASLDANRDSGAQDMQLSGNNSVGTEKDANNKKKISVEYEMSASIDDDDDCSVGGDVSDLDGESSPDSGTDTKPSISFKFGQQLQQLDSVLEESVQENQNDFVDGKRNQEGNDELDGSPYSSPYGVGRSASIELSDNSNVPMSSKVRIISKVDLSDASSDSDDEPKRIEAIKSSQLSTTQINQPMKRISFDLSNVLNADDDDDDDDDDEGSVISSENSDVNSNEFDTEGHENNGQQNENIQEDNDKTLIKLRHEERYPDTTNIDEQLTFASSSKIELPVQRGRSSTDGSDAIDVHNEFSDEAIDQILMLRNDSDVEDGDSDVSKVTAQRTIGVDPDVKFSFDSRTQIKVKVRDDDVDDDIDV